MSYAVKEMFLTLQGEGLQVGRRAVFIRFTGCNLWSGREADRGRAECTFCDTDFVGTDGTEGGRYSADALAARALDLWGGGLEPPGDPSPPLPAEGTGRPFAVLTGGEPALQVDGALVGALKARGFALAIETNGTLPAPAGLDWICVSPKAGTQVVQRAGDELKLVWPQPGVDLDELERWPFAHHLVQPMDGPGAGEALEAAIALVLARPRWRLSVQTHKLIGVR